MFTKIFGNKPPPPPFGHFPQGPSPFNADAKLLSKIIGKKLDMNPNQLSQFVKLRTNFHKKELIVPNSLKAGRDSMNTIMFSKETDENLLNSVAKRVSENEFKMEMLKIEQSKELKKICTPQQLDKFENLVNELRDYFKPKHHRPRK